MSARDNPSRSIDPMNGSTTRPNTFLESYMVFFAIVDTAQ
jgi:hypothetical protein